MGLLDAFINGMRGGLHLKKFKKRSVKTDYEAKKKEVGNFFLGLVSAKDPDFIGGGIQGAQQKGDGGYWIHAFCGRRIGSSLATIEAFGNPRGIDFSSLDYYMNDKFHTLIFNLDGLISKKNIDRLWKLLALNIDNKYDEAEIAAHLLPKDFEPLINSHALFVCASLQAVHFQMINFPIVKSEVNPYLTSCADIYDFMYPRKEIPIVKIGWL